MFNAYNHRSTQFTERYLSLDKTAAETNESAQWIRELADHSSTRITKKISWDGRCM